jgi:hypothetical protein
VTRIAFWLVDERDMAKALLDKTQINITKHNEDFAYEADDETGLITWPKVILFPAILILSPSRHHDENNAVADTSTKIFCI